MRPLRFTQIYIALGGLYIGVIVYAAFTGLAPTLPPWPYAFQGEHLLAYGLMMAWFGQLAVDRRLRATLGLIFMGLAAVCEIVPTYFHANQDIPFAGLGADVLGVWLGHRVTQQAGGRLLESLEKLF